MRVDGTNSTTGLSYGFDLQPGSGGSVIKGLEIVRFNSAGVRIASDGNTVTGSYIGTTAGGVVNCNGSHCSTNVGVSIEDSSNNTIGGTTAGERNVLSNNFSYGVQVTTISGTANGNVIKGNYVGTKPDGATALGNSYGVVVTNSGGTPPTGTVIGGTATGAGNVISGNSQHGIDLALGDTTVEGNIVGLNAAGAVALPNTGTTGIYLHSSASAVIGGPTAASRNIISGNSQEGIETGGTTGTVEIRNNYIGTDITGTSAVGNGYDGIYLPNSNAAIVDSNLIAGNNGSEAVQINGGSGAVLSNNLVGFKADGSTLLGGSPYGFVVYNSVDTTVTGNTIGGGSAYGIYASSTDGLVITGNRVGTDLTGTLDRGNGEGILVDNATQAVVGDAG